MSNAPVEYIELRRRRDLSDVIGTGFQFVRQNWKALYRPLVFICLPLYLVASLLFGNFFRTALDAGGRAAGPVMSGLGSMAIGYLCMGLAVLLLYVMVYEFMRWYMVHQGLPPSTGELWREARGRLPSYLATGLLAGLITMAGMFLFVLPGIWLAIVFSVAFPVLAFERAGTGDSIGRSFKLVRGRWWLTFGLVLVLAFLVAFISYIIYLPFILLTSFGTMSGMQDPGAAASNMGWFMTLFMLAAGVVNVLLQPLLLVPVGLHALSLMEEKEGAGLMQRVDEMTTPRPEA